MDLGEHFKNSPVICFDGNNVSRAEDVADSVLSLVKTHLVWGYAFATNGKDAPEPMISEWKNKDELIDFIRTPDHNIAFIVFGKAQRWS